MMKIFKLFAVSAAVLSLAACSSNGKDAAQADSVQTNVAQPTKALLDSVSYYMGVNFGASLKSYDFGDLNYNLMLKGMKDFVGSKGQESDSTFFDQFKYDPRIMGDVINKYLRERSEYNAAVASAKEKKFLEQNKAKEGVVESESGLQYTILEAGNENKPGPQDTVYVHYKGTLLDGTVFDEVEEKAASAALTLNRVIPAWTEGIQLIGEGGKIKLYVPSSLGYGSRGAGVIPANSTLIFDVQLDSVKRYADPAAAASVK